MNCRTRGLAAMYRIATLGLALLLAGCGAAPGATRGEQVPLLTHEGPHGFATFVNVVVDVVADPETGTPIIEFDGVPTRWPSGYTAWRVGSETEVLDANGNRVLVTGQRYRFYPAPDLLGSEPQPGVYIPGPYRIIAGVEPCSPDLFGRTCVLGFHQQDDW
jgi:hypothetical protein